MTPTILVIVSGGQTGADRGALDAALEAGVIKHKGGGHYRCGARVKIHGKAKLRQWVEGSERVRAILGQAVERWLSKQEVDDDWEDFDQDEAA